MIVPVTQTAYEKGAMVFAQPGEYQFVPVANDEELVATFIRDHGCRAVVLGAAPYVGPLYEALAAGSIILRFGVGFDNIDRGLARQRGIAIANTPGALDRSVAEHCLLLIGALVRQIVQGHQELRQGNWQPRATYELGELKLGIVGLGRIGAQVAQIAHQGFGMETLICQRSTEAVVADRLRMPVPEMRARFGYSTWSADLDAVVAGADVVSVHLPLNERTEGLFDAAQFAQFKTGSLFVNTSRGKLVVERDLVSALKSGRLAGAALDVYQHEPYRPAEGAEDLRHVPQVIMTPHSASNTYTANRRMAQMVVDNLRHWERGAMEAAYVVV